MNAPSLRSDLDAATLPRRMRSLPIDKRGYPVPWFVDINPETGEPDHRIIDSRKFRRAIQDRRCWVCGDPLGIWKTFAVGPMCGINRTTAEPPAHTDCARWSVRNCPFLSRPHAVRREAGLPEEVDQPAGVMLARNPGVTLLWTTRSYTLFRAGTDHGSRDGVLIKLGPADTVEFYREGRPATRAEVAESVDSGIPALRASFADAPIAERADNEKALIEALTAFRRLYPPE